MKFREIFYNLIIYPIISLLDIKTNIIKSEISCEKIVDRCSSRILHSTKYKNTGHSPIQKGWILTNNKSNYSIIYDNYTTNSSVLLNLRDVFDLLFYGLTMYVSGRILILTKSIEPVINKFNKNIIDRVLLYYPENINIFYQIYTKSPNIPVQILITSNKQPLSCNILTKNGFYSKPIIPSDYQSFDTFMLMVIKTWTDTCAESYIYEKRFIEAQ